MRRYILTGAPGCGKTTILRALATRGYSVVEDAASDVLARNGSASALDVEFLDAVIRLQQERQQNVPIDGSSVEIFDRSPICTLALARYAGLPLTRVLRTEVNRVVQSKIYEPLVFFVALFTESNDADAKRSEEVHRAAYESCGYELVDIPAGPVEHRVDLIDDVLADEDVRFSEEAWR